MKQVGHLLMVLFLTGFLVFGLVFCKNSWAKSKPQKKEPALERLQVSKANPHLLETTSGKPVFLNNNTLWFLLRKATRSEIAEMFSICRNEGYNMVSVMILDFAEEKGDTAGISRYGSYAFEKTATGLFNPLKPIVNEGNNIEIPGQYDFWDHLDYAIETAEKCGLYIGLHPAWGLWFSGDYAGERPGDPIIFNETNAYFYGRWLGQRYKDKKNIIWIIGGDRSAIYRIKNGDRSEEKDYRSLYRALAEGLADGQNEAENQDGKADYSKILISYHPRKWAPNSSAWFHADDWLTFNSIQDTPYDQVVSVPHDYNLKPTKPTWLYEGRYEGAITAWGVRYQAYQTVLSGGFGHTYGGARLYKVLPDWRKEMTLLGFLQMKYLYHLARGIWTDKQFLSRIPDQDLIVGDQGNTKGDGITIGDGNGGQSPTSKMNGTSDRITAMRGNDGKWAIIYTARGKDILLNTDCLRSGKMNAYWYNPRNGKWWSGGMESDIMVPFIKQFKTGNGNMNFNPPGDPGHENDWVLVIR
jgi:hypothetical protein